MKPLIRYMLLLFTLVNVVCCNERKGNVVNTTQMFEAIVAAGNKSLPLDERMQNAYRADSFAIEFNNDSVRLSAQRILGTLYLKKGDYKLSKHFFHKTLELSARLKDVETQGMALNNLGIIYHEIQEYDSAEKYYLKCIDIFSANGNKYREAQAMVNIGIVYKDRGRFDGAYTASLKGALILKNIDSLKDLASAYTNIGNILKDLYRTDDALQYHKMALELRWTNKDTADVAGSLHNIANVYRVKKDYATALIYYDSALALKQRMKLVKSSATTLDNIGEVYASQKRYTDAEVYFKKALDIRIATHNADGVITTLNKLTRLYIDMHNYVNAEKIALRVDSLVTANVYLKQRIENAAALSDIYMAERAYERAAYYALLGFNLKDSLYATSLIDTILLMNEKVKIREKERDVALLKKLQLVQRKQIHSQLTFIVVLGSLLVVLSFLAYKLYRSNKEIKKANGKIELLMQELNHRVKNNLQIVSDMLYLQKAGITEPSQLVLIQSGINRVESMNIVHTLLYKNGYTGQINMKQFVETLVESIASAYKNKAAFFDITIAAEAFHINIDKAIPTGLILNELLTNVFKYGVVATSGAFIHVAVVERGKDCILIISDNCAPWNHNEKRDVKKGLGLFLIDTLTAQLKGTFDIISNEKGTRQQLSFHK